MRCDKISEYKGIHYQTHPQVYEPGEDTFLLADNLQVEIMCRVLEIGTGTGIIAIMAARKARMVVATDFNRHALECAVKNIIANRAFNVELRKGDLFEPVQDEKFDLIIFNTPYLPTFEYERVEDVLNAAWDGGRDGRKIIDQFLDGVKDHLNENGRVQLVQSSVSDNEKTIAKLEELGFKAAVTARKKCFFEEIVVITARI